MNTQIRTLSACLVLSVGILGCESPPLDAPYVTRPFMDACTNQKNACPQEVRGEICNKIHTHAVEKKYDKIREFKNEMKREDVTVACLQYANIFEEPPSLLAKEEEYKFAKIPHCAEFAKQVANVLFELCYNESKVNEKPGKS